MNKVPLVSIHRPPRTSNVRPRYWHWTSRRPPADLMCRSCAPRGPAISWCGIPDSPYAIRHTEFGIRNSEIQNRESGIGKSGIMVRLSRPIQAVLFQAAIPPLRCLHSIQPSNTLLDPSRLQRGAFASIHPTNHHPVPRPRRNKFKTSK